MAGSPSGIEPIAGAPVSHRIPITEPTTSAISGAGARRSSRRGQKIVMASARVAMARALGFNPASAPGSERNAPIGPSGDVGAPRNGSTWISMMMMPIPDMNPETTTWGV